MAPKTSKTQTALAPITPKGTTAIAAPLPQWQLDLQKEARDESAKEVVTQALISHKGGRLSIDGKPCADGVLKLAVIDYTCSKAFYAEAFNPDVASTPSCYAFGNDEKQMAPHADAPDKQAATCAECPHNKFGTALMGKGKRCKDERRVAGVVEVTDPESIANAEVRQLTVPPGSLKNWGQYLTGLRDVTASGNVRTVLTEVGTEPYGGAYALTFKPVAKLGDDLVGAILSRRESTHAALVAPYPTISADEKPKAAPRSSKARGKLD